MINANELRIGNYILDNKILRKVTGIKLDELGDCARLDDTVTNRLTKNINPIPLTPEVVDRCGFEEYHINPRLESFLVNKDGYYPFHIYKTRDSSYYFNENLQLLHLHQLQNLYFALTGEELKVKSFATLEIQ